MEATTARFAGAHLHLTHIARQLHGLRPRDEPCAGILLDELLSVAGQHFDDEECLLASADSPLAFEHQRRHQQFINQIRIRKSQFLALAIDLQETAAWLAQWITQHERWERSHLQFLVYKRQLGDAGHALRSARAASGRLRPEGVTDIARPARS